MFSVNRFIFETTSSIVEHHDDSCLKTQDITYLLTQRIVLGTFWQFGIRILAAISVVNSKVGNGFVTSWLIYLSKAWYRQKNCAFSRSPDQDARSFWNENAFLFVIMHVTIASKSALILKLPIDPKWPSSNLQAGMTEDIKFRCHASGLFAMDRGIKVRMGATCYLQRNPDNEKGLVAKFWVRIASTLVIWTKFFGWCFFI